jgi:hypothetical protein
LLSLCFVAEFRRRLQLLCTSYPDWAKEFFKYRTSQSTGLEREIVKGIQSDEQARQTFGSLTALFEGESYAFQGAVFDSEGNLVLGKDGKPKTRTVMEVDGLLTTPDPSILLCVEAKSTPTDWDVKQVVVRAAVLGKVMDSSNPLHITNFPSELEPSRSTGSVHIVMLLGGGSFSPQTLRAAKQAHVVPVVRSGASFTLLQDSLLPFIQQSPE